MKSTLVSLSIILLLFTSCGIEGKYKSPWGEIYVYIESDGTINNGLGRANGGGSCSWEMIDDEYFRTFDCYGGMSDQEGDKRWINQDNGAVVNQTKNFAYAKD